MYFGAQSSKKVKVWANESQHLQPDSLEISKELKQIIRIVSYHQNMSADPVVFILFAREKYLMQMDMGYSIYL